MLLSESQLDSGLFRDLCCHKGASAAAKDSIGLFPGRKEAICHFIILVSCRKRGTNPANTTLDLPLPEAPTTATNGFLLTALAKLAVNSSRPQKSSASSSLKANKPR